MNEDYLLRCILNAERFIMQVDMLAGEMRIWDEEINILEGMRSEALYKARAG